MEKERKSKARLAVSALLTGKAMKSRDISEMLREKYGRDISIGTVSGILSRISDPEKCELGHFIRKSKEGNALVYALVSEARALSESGAYDLTLKRKKDRYTLEQALKDHPGLGKYCRPEKSTVFFGDNSKTGEKRPMFRVMKTLTDSSLAGRIFRIRPSEGWAEDREHRERTMEFSFRYSDQYALSVTSSFSTFVLICCVLLLVFVLCCFAVWSFFMPILIAGTFLILLRNLVPLLKRKYGHKE